MSIFHSLCRLGERLGHPETTSEIPKGIEIHLDALKVCRITTPHRVPRPREKRGSAAKTRPNPGYDTARYALSSDGLFLPYCIELASAAGDAEALAALQTYQQSPVFSRPGWHDLPKGAEAPDPIVVEGSAVKLEEWVVFLLGGTPVAMRPKILAECERRGSAALDDGNVGYCLLSGEQGPISRLHPPIKWGPTGSATTNLFSTNEDAMRFFGAVQGENFACGTRRARLYAHGLNRQLRGAAYLGKVHGIVSWPEQGVDHPLIPLITTLAQRWVKNEQGPEIDACWDQVTQLDQLDTPLTLAALQHKMARLALRHYRTLPARAVQQNLLEFWDRFHRCTPVLTFHRVLPVDTASDLCLTDTVWSILTGEPLPSELRHALRRDHSGGRAATAWLEALDGLPPHPEDESMTTTLDDYTHLLEQEIDPRLAELLRICDRHIHPSLNDKQAYRWGRLIAATCACRLYYHSLRAKHQLPNPRRQALQMGLSNPQNFRQLSRGDLYAEQIMRRTRGFKVRAFSLVYTLLTQEGPTPPRWTPAEADLVRVGFDHQILGLENLRRLGTEALNAIYRRAIGLSAAEVDDEEEEEPVASDDEAA